MTGFDKLRAFLTPEFRRRWWGERTLGLFLAIVAMAVAVCYYVMMNNSEAKNILNKQTAAIPDNVRSVMTDRFDSFRPVVLTPAAIAKLARMGVDTERLQQRQIPQNWSLSYDKLGGDGDFGPRGGHFHVASSRLCALTGPTVIPESRKLLLKWTLAMPRAGKRSFGDSLLASLGLCHSKVALGINTHDRYGNTATRILQTVKLKPGERKSVTIAMSFADGLPNFRPLAKTTGDVTFEDVAVLEAPDDFVAEEMTLMEGTLEACSVVPDPNNSDYPDCRFVCHFTGNSIIKGAPCPQNLSLVVEGFANHKLLSTSRLKPGDKVRCLVMPFDKLPNERQSTQQVDDLNLFTLSSYYALEIHKISDFIEHPQLASPASNIFFTDTDDQKEYVSVFDRHINPPLTDAERRLQAEAIRDDLAKIKTLLAEYTPEKREALRFAFDKAWETEKKKDAPGYNRVGPFDRTGVCVWRNIDNSFWALPEDYHLVVEESKLSVDKIEALVALRDFLEANGCQLIVSLVPDFYEVAARVINRDFCQAPDFQTAAVVKQLLENGIETVYGTDSIIKNYNRYPWAYFYPHDAHPSDTVQDILTDLVAEKLQRYHFAATLDKKLFTIRDAPHHYGDNKAYTFPANCNIGKNVAGVAYCCREVLYDGKEAAMNLLEMRPAPVFVCGNSYVMLPKRQSFATLLSAKTGLAINAVTRVNYGPLTVAIQDFFASPDKMLSQKKVMVMQLGTNHVLADYQFNNIRQMDDMAKLLSGKIQVGTLAFAKPDDIPETLDNALDLKMYKQLPSAKVFQLPREGKKFILQTSLTKYELTKETVIVVPAVKTADQHVQLKINDSPVEISTGIKYTRLKLANIVIRLPAGIKTLEIQAVGTPGAVFAVRDVQLFQ